MPKRSANITLVDPHGLTSQAKQRALVEAGQVIVSRFAKVYRVALDSEEAFEFGTSIVKCKDYLNEVLFYEKHPGVSIPMIYGMTFEHLGKLKVHPEWSYIFHSINDLNLFKARLAVFNEFYETKGFKPIEILPLHQLDVAKFGEHVSQGIGSFSHILKIDNKWFEIFINQSLVLLLIRLMSNPEKWQPFEGNFAKWALQGGLASSYPYAAHYLNNIEKYAEIAAGDSHLDKYLPKVGPGNKFEGNVGSIHGMTGILALNHQCNINAAMRRIGKPNPDYNPPILVTKIVDGVEAAKCAA